MREIPDLTNLFEELTAKEYLAGQAFTSLFRKQLQTLLMLANAQSDQKFDALGSDYMETHERYYELMQSTFGIDTTVAFPMGHAPNNAPKPRQ